LKKIPVNDIFIQVIVFDNPARPMKRFIVECIYEIWDGCEIRGLSVPEFVKQSRESQFSLRVEDVYIRPNHLKDEILRLKNLSRADIENMGASDDDLDLKVAPSDEINYFGDWRMIDVKRCSYNHCARILSQQLYQTVFLKVVKINDLDIELSSSKKALQIGQTKMG